MRWLTDTSHTDVARYICDHTWPAELDKDAACQVCGLKYKDWTE